MQVEVTYFTQTAFKTVLCNFIQFIASERLRIMNRSIIKHNMCSLQRRPFRVSVEGNIGSGKSTCLNYFSQFKNIDIHPEPIDQWRDVSGHNLFGMVYSNLTKWNFAFQHYVQLTRLKIQTSPPLSNETAVKMFERSVQNNRYCFIENAHQNKKLHDCEYEILCSWFNFIESHMDIDLDLIVYLKSTPEVVWHRMVKRGRAEENTVPLSYLKEIHMVYEDWLNNPELVKCPVLTIDADKDLDDVLNQLKTNTPTILGGQTFDTVIS